MYFLCNSIIFYVYFDEKNTVFSILLFVFFTSIRNFSINILIIHTKHCSKVVLEEGLNAKNFFNIFFYSYFQYQIDVFTIEIKKRGGGYRWIDWKTIHIFLYGQKINDGVYLKWILMLKIQIFEILNKYNTVVVNIQGYFFSMLTIEKNNWQKNEIL